MSTVDPRDTYSSEAAPDIIVAPSGPEGTLTPLESASSQVPPARSAFAPWQPQAGDVVPAETETRGDIPPVAPGADLARVPVSWRSGALCFLLTFIIYLLFVPKFLQFSSPPTGDQVYYML